MRGRTGIYAAAAAAIAAALVLVVLGTGEEEGPKTVSNAQAFILGIVQGATELLPISSSGHLVLVPWAGDWESLKDNEEFNHTFDVALHIGTLLAVVAYFWRDLGRLIAAWFRSVGRRSIVGGDERIAWFIVVATIPAALIGAVGENFIASELGEPWQIAILLAVFAVVLWIADRRPQARRMDSLTIRDALIIGTAQAAALAPGVSRSGITISAGRFLRLDRDAAARMSFLLLVPTTLGAILYKGLTDVVLGDLPRGWEGPFLVGILASAASGFLAIVFLLGFVRRHTYTPFVVYRLIAAAIVLLIIATGVREATF
jgi:undecaprenyl-diphosphatase